MRSRAALLMTTTVPKHRSRATAGMAICRYYTLNRDFFNSARWRVAAYPQPKMMGQNMARSDNLHLPTTEPFAIDGPLIDVASIWKPSELGAILLDRPLDFLFQAPSRVVIEPHPTDFHLAPHLKIAPSGRETPCARRSLLILHPLAVYHRIFLPDDSELTGAALAQGWRQSRG